MDALAAVAVLLGAIAQAVTGFGFSLVGAPFLVAAYDAPDGVQLNLAISVIVNIALLLTARQHVQWRTAGELFLPAAVTTVALGLLLRGTESDALTVLAGALGLLGVLAVARNRPLRRLTGPAATAGVGALSGGMTVVAGFGGPPVVLFGLNAGWEPRSGRATLQAYFLGLNLVALAALGLPDRVPPLVVAGVVVGVIVGRTIAGSVPPIVVRRASLIVAAAGSLLAVVRGLTG